MRGVTYPAIRQVFSGEQVRIVSHVFILLAGSVYPEGAAAADTCASCEGLL